MSERELAERIIYLHDIVGLGFRKIVKKLRSEGIEISKDKAFRLYHKYKPVQANTEEIVDKEIEFFNQEIQKREQNVKLAQTKDEKRRRIAALIVEEKMTSFEKRKQLFSDADELLKFAEIVMPIVDPMLWDEFKEFCEEQGYALANAVVTAIGKQRYFEDQLAEGASEKQSLDQYLREQIEESLDAWKEEDKEESSEPTDYEPDTTIIIEGDDEEYVTIPLSPANEDSEYEEIVI